MPPKAVALFEVACSFYSTMAEGQTQSDFTFGGRELICPGVLVALQTLTTVIRMSFSSEHYYTISDINRHVVF